LSIEQYCKRKFIKRKCTDYHTFYGENTFTLREYPVRKIISVGKEKVIINDRKSKSVFEDIEPEYYYCIPEIGICEDLPYSVIIRTDLLNIPKNYSFKIIYSAGYSLGKAPADLASACFELASWNLNRYRSKNIGMTSNVKGKGRDGVHFEETMPVNVKALLEPYRRKTI
jgi:hypothetical protein